MRLLLGLAVAALASAQTYTARHDHWRGFCTGRLSFDENGVAFESDKNKDHSWKVAYLDIQQALVRDDGEFEVLTYKDRKWRLGADRQYRLKVEDAGFAAQVSPMLETRLDRRFVAALSQAAPQILWELPVKHLLRFSGTEGTLAVAEDRIVYRTDRPGESRTWEFSDIDSVSTSGPYQLTITTYERARGHYGDTKGFNFQLKQPLIQDRYNDLWRRIEKAKGLQIDPFARLHEDLDRRTGESLTRLNQPEPEAAPAPALAAGRRTAWDWLPALARVESNFNPSALSPKGALGTYQFMPDTARRFGLRVEPHADDRIHAGRSAVAAARYLSFLHGLFGDWELALAAYNAGENRVSRAITRAGTRDFFELSRRGLLPEETRRYVPRVLENAKGE